MSFVIYCVVGLWKPPNNYEYDLAAVGPACNSLEMNLISWIWIMRWLWGSGLLDPIKYQCAVEFQFGVHAWICWWVFGMFEGKLYFDKMSRYRITCIDNWIFLVSELEFGMSVATSVKFWMNSYNGKLDETFIRFLLFSWARIEKQIPSILY